MTTLQRLDQQRRRGPRWVQGLLWLALVPCTLPRAQGLSPAAAASAKPVRAALEAAALELDRAGRPELGAEILRLLARLGGDPARRRELQERMDRTPTSRDGPRSRLERGRQRLRKATGQLAERLEGAGPDDLQTFAEVILAIDGDHPRAHRALGHRRVEGEWTEDALARMVARRAEIQNKLQELRRLDLPVNVRPSRHPLLREAAGDDGLAFAAGWLEIHTALPTARAQRLLRNLQRAMRLSRWLVADLDREPVHARYVLFADRRQYEAAAAQDRASNQVAGTDRRRAGDLENYYRKDGTVVVHAALENDALALLFCDASGASRGRLHGHPVQPCLAIGHATWVLLALTGARPPSILQNSERDRTRTTSADADAPARQRLASAGLTGMRTALRGLARRGGDPPWARSFQDQVGKIGGDDLLKSAIVVEYLQERSILHHVCTATRRVIGRRPAEVVPAMEQALGQPMDAFEQDWRAWLAEPAQPPLLTRLSAPAAVGEALPSLLTLHQVRTTAFAGTELPDTNLADLPAVMMDADLSRGAQLHAGYLARHKDQIKSWPEIHEEFTDRAGFTVEGAWAASHSIIAPGLVTIDAAIEAWMGTFYHRLPLLHPGLLRVGWGTAADLAVLDAGSMVRPILKRWVVVWPTAGATEVPLRFVPELPNPVPGASQARWGFPVTVQLGDDGSRPAPAVAELELRRDAPDGALVPTHRVRPATSVVPGASTQNAHGLIPKKPLAPATTYHVSLRIAGRPPLEWSFRTQS